MTYDDLLLEKRDGIATITLNAPDKMNALTIGMRKSILSVTEELAQDDEVRVVVVTGAGRGFCAGADLSGGGGGELSRQQRLGFLGPTWGAEAFFKLEKPVIAAINGACVGAGFSLALSMDIRIASEAARFGAVFILRGLTPDCGITYWLPKAVGTSKALELMYTGEIIDAAEAERIGIVSKVVPPDDLMKVTQELAGKIAQQAPLSVELTKKMVYRGMIDDFWRQIEIETYANHVTGQSEDSQEAVRAFFEKRPPSKFKGR